MVNTNWYCVLHLGTELEGVIPVASPGMVRLGGNQVAACHQLVALDGGVVVDGPLVILEGLGVVLDTNNKTAFLR